MGNRHYSADVTSNLSNPVPAKAQVVWPKDVTANDYANVTAVGQTPWDFAIYFGQVTTPLRGPNDPLPEGIVDIAPTPIAGVRLHPSAAVQLRDFLTDQIGVYEAVNGSIRRMEESPPNA